MARDPDKQVFNKTGRKHYRRSYSTTEVRIGAGIVLILVAIAAWVVYRGAHPDPELFAPAPPQQDRGQKVDRGALPEGLTPDGWVERSLSRFDSSDLYKKINGREGFYKSFGFEQLFFVSLQKKSDPSVAVDIELYDLGQLNNALGAYAEERGEEAKVLTHEGGLHHTTENALFAVMGHLYIRAIGTSGDAEIKEVLAQTLKVFTAQPGAEPLPWGYVLFGAQMGLNISKLAFVPENAFSIDAADNVFVAGIDDDLDVFAGRPEDPKLQAEAMLKGFQSYGEPHTEAGRSFVVDRYLSTYATADVAGAFVIGVKGAPDVATAQKWMQTLSEAVSKVPDLGAAAPGAASTPPAAPPKSAEESYE